MKRKSPSVTGEPLVTFGREVCDDLSAALRREWVVTNGLGGFASGTVAGCNTRRYHALLVAAMAPPGDRFVFAGGLQEEVTYEDRSWPLSTHEWGSRHIAPEGFVHCESFRLEGMLPVWTYAISDALIEKRVWMAYGQNTTYVSYRVLRASAPVAISLLPLLTCRTFHSLQPLASWAGEFEVATDEIRMFLPDGLPDLRVIAPGMRFTAARDWYWDFYLREEGARGLDARADMFGPGEFETTLVEGESCALVLTSETGRIDGWLEALSSAQERQGELLRVASADTSDAVIQQLVLAADQFIVQRTASPGPGSGGEPEVRAGRTIIAGYHWFADWGRDAMIALPGLTLATGRFDDAAGILRTFAAYEQDGLFPNNLPGSSTGTVEYNTVDAGLWFIYVLRAYRDATNDERLVAELLPTVGRIIEAYAAGTRYGISVDPVDGLLRAGDRTTQLTWMDARVDGRPVTPRAGKAVEVNALWYNALRAYAGFLGKEVGARAHEATVAAERVRNSFRRRFIREGGESVADVVDGPDGDDFTLRPNAIFAASLRDSLLDVHESALLIERAARNLYTSHGLRSLAPGEPSYAGGYGGSIESRDGAYHQGTAWSWLIGPWIDVHLRLSRDPASARGWLGALSDHLQDAGLGTVSEIFDGDAPHAPAGCIAQAWGVAELLRVLRLTSSNAERAMPG